ncbi:MAG: DUF2332 domain-containing protein, partial [Solirubrobacteraceae bacterium]
MVTWLRGHSRWLQSRGRSPLYARLMAEAADDMEAGGVVARLFDGIDVPAGSMPQLRLMAALHELVLCGRDAELAEFFPSAGGDRGPDGVWPVAHLALERDFHWIRERLGRPVQTNEPGRAAVLLAVLVWLTARHGLPIRLLEIGASAGLNLGFDSYRYEIDGVVLGDPRSAVAFHEPWAPGPDLGTDLSRISTTLKVSERAGCDPSPRDPGDPGDRLRLLSYIWPDELERFRRLEAALDIAAREPQPVAAGRAGDWLPGQLVGARQGELTL